MLNSLSCVCIIFIFLYFDSLATDTRPPGPAPALLDWPTVHKEMQWGVLLLLGGGFAIADACKVSSRFSAAAMWHGRDCVKTSRICVK
jgi:di/tricarboxylate transporter